MMKNNLKTLLMLLATATLFACGGVEASDQGEDQAGDEAALRVVQGRTTHDAPDRCLLPGNDLCPGGDNSICPSGYCTVTMNGGSSCTVTCGGLVIGTGTPVSSTAK